MNRSPATSLTRWIRTEPGWTALLALALIHWVSIILTTLGRFDLWPLALPFLTVAVGLGVAAWWRSAAGRRWLLLGMVLLGAVLYTPPGEHLAMTGDAAIYPNAGGYIARTGGLSGVYDPLAVVPLAARDPFFQSSAEQDLHIVVTNYEGLVYGAYYVTDLDAPTLHTSRPPLVESWFALAQHILGIQSALYTTAIFATLGVMVLFGLGTTLWGWQAGLWAALLLAFNYAQIHFGRAPYAEIFGQFWTLTGLWAGVIWLRDRRSVFLMVALICWTTTWAARLDAFMLLGAVGLLLAFVGLHRDRKSLVGVLLLLPLIGIGLILGTNKAYIFSTEEFTAARWAWFRPAELVLLGGLAGIIPLFWWLGSRLEALARKIAPVGHGIVLLGFGWVLAWSTLPNPWRVMGIYRDFQEVPWFSSQFITPLLLWLAWGGLLFLVRRGYRREEFLVGATFVSLAAIFFYSYTTGPVYPVSLRRLIGDVIPLMALLGGSVLGIAWPLPERWRKSGRWAQAAVGAGALAWMVLLSWPVIQQHELAGTTAFVADFHAHLPADGVFVFEQQDEDSWVGWLAAPLFSFYGDWTLLLDTDTPNPAHLSQAVTAWEEAGRDVYVVSQHDPVPSALVPPGYVAELILRDEWRSSLIGQTRLPPYPPPFWEFVFPVQVYRITPESN